MYTGHLAAATFDSNSMQIVYILVLKTLMKLLMLLGTLGNKLKCMIWLMKVLYSVFNQNMTFITCLHATYTQITPQLAVLCGHPEASPVLQADERVLRVFGPVFLQEPAFKVGQNPVHVHQNPELLTGGHVDGNPLNRITE